MEGVFILEGTLMIERDPGKVYIVNKNNNAVHDLNCILAKWTGETVRITVNSAVTESSATSEFPQK